MMPSNYHILCCPFPPCPQSFPVSWSSNELALCIRCQSIGASASASVLPMHIQSWFPLELTGLISFLSKGLSSIFSSTTVWSINSSALSLIYGSTLTFIPDYMSLWDPYNPTGVKPSNIYLSSQNAVQNHCLKSLCGPANAATWIITTTTLSYTQSIALATRLWVLELARVSTSALLPFLVWLCPTHLKLLTVKSKEALLGSLISP